MFIAAAISIVLFTLLAYETKDDRVKHRAGNGRSRM